MLGRFTGNLEVNLGLLTAGSGKIAGVRQARLLRGSATILAVAAAVVVAGGSAAAFTIAKHNASSARGAGSRGDPEPAPGNLTPASEPATSGPAQRAGSGNAYRTVGLGDSVPAGTACDCPTYVALVGAQEASRVGRTAAVSNLAQPGLTTAGLASQLTDASVRATVAAADLIVITIGANDFDPDLLNSDDCAPATDLWCYRSALDDQRARLESVLSQIVHLRTGPGTRIILTGYWDVFVDGSVGRAQGASFVRGSNALTLADNAVISSVGSAYGVTYVDLYALFKGDGAEDDTDLLAADGDHPNAAGHRLIARALVNALA